MNPASAINMIRKVRDMEASLPRENETLLRLSFALFREFFGNHFSPQLNTDKRVWGPFICVQPCLSVVTFDLSSLLGISPPRAQRSYLFLSMGSVLSVVGGFLPIVLSRDCIKTPAFFPLTRLCREIMMKSNLSVGEPASYDTRP